LARGRGTSSRKKDKIYEDFAILIEEAEADFESQYLSIIAQAAAGQPVVKTKITTKPDGTVIEEVTETIERHWMAAKWMLERRFPHRYGGNRMSEMEAVRILVDANWLPDAAIEAIVVGGENFQSHMQDSFKAIGAEEANSGNSRLMPDPMSALDVLIQQGWFPRTLRTRILRASPTDRARIARDVFAAWAAQHAANMNNDDDDDDDDDI
jgi:hypothetical protein